MRQKFLGLTSLHAMPQDHDSGAAGDKFGRETAPRIAQAIGATMLGTTSNEALFDGKRVVIKSARSQTPSVGVTHQMLERLDFVIGAFQRDDGAFEVILLPADVYRARRTETQSRGASAGGVGIVAKSVFTAEGRRISIVKI
jgi:hypothetical protein